MCNSLKIGVLALVFKLTWKMDDWKLTRKLLKPMSMPALTPTCGVSPVSSASGPVKIDITAC